MSIRKNKQITREITKEITKDTVPTTPAEAIQVLDILLSDDDKDYLRTTKNAAIMVHHSLGRWIRNNWGLWADEPNELKSYFINKGVTHPDDMSGEILDAYVEYLKSTEQ